jgi:hypothetical protein
MALLKPMNLWAIVIMDIQWKWSIQVGRIRTGFSQAVLEDKRVIVTDIYLLIGSACPGPACIAKVEGLINEGRKAW